MYLPIHSKTVNIIGTCNTDTLIKVLFICPKFTPYYLHVSITINSRPITNTKANLHYSQVTMNIHNCGRLPSQSFFEICTTIISPK